MFRNFLDALKRTFPVIFRVIFRIRDFFIVDIPVHVNISRFQKAVSESVKVFYLTKQFPKRPATRNEHTHGGSVKLTYLSEVFPHSFPSANLAYVVTSIGHPMKDDICHSMKSRGLKFVVNHDGIAFPAWAGENYLLFNQVSKRTLDQADFIVFQSQFSKISTDIYLSPPNVPYEIVYNPVDIKHFSPQKVKKPQVLTLLLGGNQYEKYRLELALQTLQALHKDIPSAKLIVTGNLWLPYRKAWEWTTRTLKDLKLTDHVEFSGVYTQAEAPYLYSRAHMLLHTKYADPCPGLVPEALGCGLPVVHIGNGGVPELVEEAGISIPIEHSWDVINLPDPQKMAEAVLHVYESLENYSQAARQQAQKFSLENFLAHHKDIFVKVLETN